METKLSQGRWENQSSVTLFEICEMVVNAHLLPLPYATHPTSHNKNQSSKGERDAHRPVWTEQMKSFYVYLLLLFSFFAQVPFTVLLGSVFEKNRSWYAQNDFICPDQTGQCVMHSA